MLGASHRGSLGCAVFPRAQLRGRGTRLGQSPLLSVHRLLHNPLCYPMNSRVMGLLDDAEASDLMVAAPAAGQQRKVQVPRQRSRLKGGSVSKVGVLRAVQAAHADGASVALEMQVGGYTSGERDPTALNSGHLLLSCDDSLSCKHRSCSPLIHSSHAGSVQGWLLRPPLCSPQAAGARLWQHQPPSGGGRLRRRHCYHVRGAHRPGMHKR